MNRSGPTPPWRVMKALWRAARRRAAGRRARQAALTQRRKGNSGDTLQSLGALLMAAFLCMIHGFYGLMATQVMESAALIEADRAGRLVVSSYDLRWMETRLLEPEGNGRIAGSLFADAAEWRIENVCPGSSEEEQVELLREVVAAEGIDGLIGHRDVPGRSLRDIARFSPGQSGLLVGLVLWWFLMLVGQGEGLELDVQRRRHPMWEWLACHPVRPWSAFVAEMAAPWMANPAYATAPIFLLVVLGSAWGPTGMLVAVPLGLLLGLAASAAAKCFEIGVLVRVGPLNRGALLGLASWFGYVGLFLPLFLMAGEGLLVRVTTGLLPLAEALPMEPLRWAFTGPFQALLGGIVAALGLLLAMIPLLAWILGRGVQPAASTQARPSRGAGFGRRPAWRKEVLWLLRDRGAVVQAFLIPLTLAAAQLFNLRILIEKSNGSWNGLAGVAVLFGTYFLFVLGPRSLASEGSALWIALTWPRNLESLLRAKARMWFLLSCTIVVPILGFTWWRFPEAGGWIALTGIGWWFFGRSLSEKTVTLVTPMSSSGEAEPVPAARRWAAMAGTFAFAAGILSGAWSIAVLGVVFSLLSSAAMWQGLRERLPYLFDPWSEKEPPAPSLIHAMVGIAILTECVAIVSGVAYGFGGSSMGWAVRALSYGVVGVIGFAIMTSFLEGKGVKLGELFRWEGAGHRGVAASCGLALALAVGLAGLAQLYLWILRVLPITADWMGEYDQARETMAAARPWIALMAVGIAPFVEEFFFRGLLYRSLTRVWKPVAAMAGSAAYFAVYHPPVAWLPVFGVGLASAWLFRRSGSLWPGILLHASYNALVVALG